MRTSIFAVILILGAATVQAEPRLVVLAPTFEFGYTPQNSAVQHRFWFRAAGTDTVRIKEIKTDCACALMPLERDWLAPGDSMEVTITWELGRITGGILRSPYVFCNASPDPMKLYLSASVTPFPDSVRPVSVRPFRFELARASIRDIDSIGFTLTNHSDDEVNVRLISPLPRQIDVVLPDVVPGNSGSTGYVRLKPEFADTEFNTSITLMTTDPKNTHVTIPVRRKFYLDKGN
jgi:hypothetical protein